MKSVLSWLGDPYLHLLAIGTVVVAISAARSTRGGESAERCDACNRMHEDGGACPQLAANPLIEADRR
jgi:hypothetical protein